MRLLPVADHALLVEAADLQEVLALHAALVAAPIDGVVELVPAALTLMLHLDNARTDPDAVAVAVRETAPHPDGAPPARRRLEVPVTYDGADLAEVGRLTGLGEQGVVEAHTSREWTVAFCGFAPGFGYLVASDDRLHVPRRDEPRTRVPPGAVALAGEFSGVYPRESPGGWQLIGRTSLATWDLESDPPALLAPGTRVRFVETPDGRGP